MGMNDVAFLFPLYLQYLQIAVGTGKILLAPEIDVKATAFLA